MCANIYRRAKRNWSFGLNVEASQTWALSKSNFAARWLADGNVSRLAQGLASAVSALSPGRICIGGDLGRAIFALIHAELASELRDSLQTGAFAGDIVLSAHSQSGPETIASGAWRWQLWARRRNDGSWKMEDGRWKRDAAKSFNPVVPTSAPNFQLQLLTSNFSS